MKHYQCWVGDNGDWELELLVLSTLLRERDPHAEISRFTSGVIVPKMAVELGEAAHQATETMPAIGSAFLPYPGIHIRPFLCSESQGYGF